MSSTAGILNRMGSFGHADAVLGRLCSEKHRRTILSTLGRLLLVITFIEDGIRIFARWESQMSYLTLSLKRSWLVAATKLFLCAAVQLGGSALILRPQYMAPNRARPAYALLAFLVLQPVLFGVLNDAEFVGRSAAHVGGLLLLIWSERERETRKSGLGLEAWDSSSAGRQDWLQLVGRALLTVVFMVHPIALAWSEPTALNLCSVLGLLTVSSLVCVGFKTELSAVALILVLGCSDAFMYAYWREAHEHRRDIKKYYFFQTLAIMGGLMLLALHGPGGVSVEHKWGAKKGL